MASGVTFRAELPLACGERVTRAELPLAFGEPLPSEQSFHSPAASESFTLRPSRLSSSFPRRRDCRGSMPERTFAQRMARRGTRQESRVIQRLCFYLSKHKLPLACGERVAHASSVTPWLVIPAKAGIQCLCFGCKGEGFHLPTPGGSLTLARHALARHPREGGNPVPLLRL